MSRRRSRLRRRRRRCFGIVIVVFCFMVGVSEWVSEYFIYSRIVE